MIFVVDGLCTRCLVPFIAVFTCRSMFVSVRPGIVGSRFHRPVSLKFTSWVVMPNGGFCLVSFEVFLCSRFDKTMASPLAFLEWPFMVHFVFFSPFGPHEMDLRGFRCRFSCITMACLFYFLSFLFRSMETPPMDAVIEGDFILSLLVVLYQMTLLG